MTATRLLVLAFVRAHGRAHGYIIGQDLLAWDADKWANTKTGSIYHALRQLTKEGLLLSIEIDAGSQTGARTDYEITPAGETEFQELIKTALTVPDPRPDMLCAGLVLMPTLPRQTVLDYLRQRLDTLNEHRTVVLNASGKARWAGDGALPPHVESLLDYWRHHTDSSAIWISDLIDTIAAGAYVFVDEDPKAFGAPGSQISRP